MSEGRFTIPTRIYLAAAERDKLERLLRTQGRELDDLLSELASAYLAEQAEPPMPPDERASALSEELHRRRSELRLLRPRLHDQHNPPPVWLVQLVTELEAEVARLERDA